MPIFEYRCRACGDTIEALRSPDDADQPVACACGLSDTVRLPSLIARSSSGGQPTASSGGGCCGGGACACGQ